MRKAKYLFGLIAILYPLFVFLTLVIFKLPIRYFSIGIIVFAIAYSVVNSRNYKGKHTIALFVSPLILCAIGAVSLCLDKDILIKLFPNIHDGSLLQKLLLVDDDIFIKLYPALADLAYLTIMATSFIFPPPLAFYFIDIFDKTMKTVIPKHKFDVYCFRASLVWCVYFVVDGIIAALTTFYLDSFHWGIYNAGITYLIMGLIFVSEFIILKRKLKKYTLKAVENLDASGAPVKSVEDR